MPFHRVQKGGDPQSPKDPVNFKDGYIRVEGIKNGEIRKMPMKERLSEVLKKVIIKNSE